MRGAIAAAGREEPLTDEQSMLYHLATPVSIHKPLGGDGDAELGDTLQSPDRVEDAVVQEVAHSDLLFVVEQALKNDPEALELIKMRLGFYSYDNEPKSLREIGENRGVTAEAVRRHISRGIVIIRSYLLANGYEADDFML
jgi:RNA polymerase primary sigma factor